MKKTEIIEQITTILSSNGKLTPQEIHERIKGELPLVQVYAALKSMVGNGVVKIEKLGNDMYYHINRSSLAGKKEKQVSNRDTTKYTFDGKKDLSKGRLALAIVQRYCLDKKPTLNELKEIFPDKIVKPYGVVRILSEAKEMSKERKRFYINEEDVITLNDGTKICTTNQLTTTRIGVIIAICEKELSLKVTAQK